MILLDVELLRSDLLKSEHLQRMGINRRLNLRVDSFFIALRFFRLDKIALTQPSVSSPLWVVLIMVYRDAVWNLFLEMPFGY